MFVSTILSPSPAFHQKSQKLFAVNTLLICLIKKAVEYKERLRVGRNGLVDLSKIRVCESEKGTKRNFL